MADVRLSQKIKRELRALGSPERAEKAKRFFKTDPGDYAEGDVFLGLKVGEMRLIAKSYAMAKLADIVELLTSKMHEDRQTALLLLATLFKKSAPAGQKEIFDFYLHHARFVNNWDLVDCSAEIIVGTYLLDKPKKILRQLAASSVLWERRIAIVATLAFIKNGDFKPTLALSRQLFHDPEDLMHKAVGWMLREVGKRDKHLLRTFLGQFGSYMSRTTLRYAIEHFSPLERRRYLSLKKTVK